MCGRLVENVNVYLELRSGYNMRRQASLREDPNAIEPKLLSVKLDKVRVVLRFRSIISTAAGDILRLMLKYIFIIFIIKSL